MQRSLLTKLGLSWISARSKHPKQDKEAQALYKKLQTKGNKCLTCRHRLDDWQNPIFAQLVISLNLVLAGLRLGLKNRQVGEKWVSDDCSYLCKGL
jgi:hypothetical protein